ncbi:MAG: urease accessory UreF family protein [Cyanobacteriota bacterium]|nr:urease accessory UreF family protein [Cyanobacteriota bacterium]
MATAMAEQRLHLFQLVSPALPVGAFSYSEGLEVLVQSQSITDAESLGAWLRAELNRGAVALETAALGPLRQAWLGWQRGEGAAALLDLDSWLLAQREAPEMRAQQRQMGQSLLQLLADLQRPAAQAPAPLPRVAWPAAFAWAGHGLGIGSPALEEAYLYGWVANQVSAALRLIPLGPTEGQRLQLALAGLLAERAAALTATQPETLWNGGWGAALAQLSHAELYSRLFRS